METTKIKSLAGPGELVLYGRRGCVHCEQLQFALELLKNRGRPPLNEAYRYVDIDDDEVSREYYDLLVPVLCWGQRVICAGSFNVESLESDLQLARREMA